MPLVSKSGKEYEHLTKHFILDSSITPPKSCQEITEKQAFIGHFSVITDQRKSESNQMISKPKIENSSTTDKRMKINYVINED